MMIEAADMPVCCGCGLEPTLVERMMAHLRKCAAESVAKPNDLHREMLALVAEFPAPVDPLLIEAREMLAGLHERGLDLMLTKTTPYVGYLGEGIAANTTVLKNGAASPAIRAGDYDEHGRLLELLAALKRGQELAHGMTLTAMQPHEGE